MATHHGSVAMQVIDTKKGKCTWPLQPIVPATQGMHEELEDGAAALEGMTSAGLDGLERMQANLKAVERGKLGTT